jgi:Holliday junction resolvase RusA-like endonuclease
LNVRSVIEFEVPGVPRPQPRPRTRVVQGNPDAWGSKRHAFAHIYTPDTNKEWKQAMRLAARRATRETPLPVWDQFEPQRKQPWDQAVRVDIEAFFEPPAWLKKYMDRQGALAFSGHDESLPMLEKPDRDNLDKVVLDVLTQEGWWADDSHVYVGKVGKWYVRPGYAPGVKIRVQFEELHHEYLAIRRLHAGQLAKAKARAKAKRDGEPADTEQMRLDQLPTNPRGRGKGRISSEDARKAGLI